MLHAVAHPPTTHARSTSACIPTQIFRLRRLGSVVRIVRAALAAAAELLLLACRRRCWPAIPRASAASSPARPVPVCRLPNKPTDTLPASASLPRRHPSSHPAKALHLTSTDCSGALIGDVYESQLDPVSVCHPTPQSALIVAVQTLLTPPPATCLHSRCIFTGYSLPLASKYRHPWPSPSPATFAAARVPLPCTRPDTVPTSLLIFLSVCLPLRVAPLRLARRRCPSLAAC